MNDDNQQPTDDSATNPVAGDDSAAGAPMSTPGAAVDPMGTPATGAMPTGQMPAEGEENKEEGGDGASDGGAPSA